MVKEEKACTLRVLADFRYGQRHTEIISIGMGLISCVQRGFSHELHNFAAVWSQIWRENTKIKQTYILLFQFQM